MNHHRANPCVLLLLSLCGLALCVPCFEMKGADDTAKHEENPFLISKADIKNPSRFVAELSSTNATPLSQYVWKQFSADGQKSLTNPNSTDEAKRAALVKELNGVLEGSLIYDKERFEDVKLSADTSTVVQHPQDEYIPRLNRMLLEDAYPRELEMNPRIPPSPPAVFQVARHGPDGDNRKNPVRSAQRSDDIFLDVYNFDHWLDELRAKGKLPNDHDIRNLILYVDHIPLAGVSPIYWYEWPPAYKTEQNNGKTAWVKDTITTVGFTLVRNERSKAAWAHLLSQPVLKRQVVVSLGFENGEEIDSYLKGDGKKDEEQFFLTVIPYRTVFGLAVILGALLAFLSLARNTHIIRDATAPRRPDGLRPYSLARAQMAFWFFLVIASYFFLWIVTGDMDTLNSSVLGLIGISAGTALGSAFIDSGKPLSAGTSANVPPIDVSKPRLEVVEEMKKLRSDTLKELEALQKARALIPVTGKQELENNERQQNEVRERLANYRWQNAYFAWPKWKGVMYDLLAENNLISFHRFQIFVWTLVLGIMFVVNVYNDLAMPQFSATLLGLLGISGGTYIGFKLPEPKPQ